MLLERLLLLRFPSFIFAALETVRWGGAGLVLGENASVRGRSMGDSLTVLFVACVMCLIACRWSEVVVAA